ncbi:hypothetical protein Nepgr_022759 [Nepenthes gracilis]|uniref:Uncharacterized protein n=1 Tax=Nepenthes gracilis TaxID=150966 RepID=A0AAD3T1H9_NEPGR|nr:hypothetical protein Nepgr_022759 [Nepenthes gracilis]
MESYIGYRKIAAKRKKAGQDGRKEPIENDYGSDPKTTAVTPMDEDDPQREEEKIEKFYALIRSCREARDRQRIELQSSSEAERRESKKTKVAQGAESSWIPSFKWEDFTVNRAEFPMILPSACHKIKTHDDRMDQHHNRSPPKDDGLDLKLAL